MSHVPSRSLRSLICNFKPIYSLLNSIGVIYSIPCKNCDCIYIGQTVRKLHDRINEHRRAYKIQDLSFSKLFQHLLDLSAFKRLLTESFNAKISNYSITEAVDVPSEYVVFTLNFLL